MVAKRSNRRITLAVSLASLVLCAACTTKVAREELTGKWYLATNSLAAIDFAEGNVRQASLMLNYNATFTARNFPSKILYNGARGEELFDGSGTWWMSESGGFETIMLDFENVRGGAPAVSQVLIDRENGKPYIFAWHDEEGSNRIRFERAK